MLDPAAALCGNQCQRKRTERGSPSALDGMRRQGHAGFRALGRRIPSPSIRVLPQRLLKEIRNRMHAIRNQSPWFEMKKCSFSEERRRRYCDEHQAILDRLVRRAPECAKNAMLAQLKTVERNLLGR
ncbi:FCD domain-containing protein [Mesorhizobium caraganae]|uniref:FCD domain-containing protein n=1 Tax=Mesorhizobium caraganae TaxID=483206 RepID=UPI00178640EE|nr:FCD domain-containing protein [Mesorhizobium caraganae]